jgi:AbrB family looped-hinge helix DNA binding protein
MSTMQTRIGQNGRIVIPADMRAALDLQPGDEVVLHLEDGEIRLIALRESVRRARELFRRHVPPGTPVVEGLIAERRQEAEHE